MNQANKSHKRAKPLPLSMGIDELMAVIRWTPNLCFEKVNRVLERGHDV
jgi:hypothetical protein